MTDRGDVEFGFETFDHMVDDDRDRVCKEDDELRGTLVVGPDGEDLVYTPADDYEPFSSKEYRAMRDRYDGRRWNS